MRDNNKYCSNFKSTLCIWQHYNWLWHWHLTKCQRQNNIKLRTVRLNDRSEPRPSLHSRSHRSKLLNWITCRCKSHIITQLTIFTIKYTYLSIIHSLHKLCIFRDLQPLYKSYIGKRHSKYKTVVTIYKNESKL